MNNTSLALETIRLLWKDGLERVDLERKNKGFDKEEYKRRLGDVLASIRSFLKANAITGLKEVLVKHGEEAVIVIVNYDDIRFQEDPQDPEKFIFHIPATRKDNQ